MNQNQSKVLQLCPFSSYLEAELTKRFDVVEWFRMSEAEQRDWLGQHAASVTAVATGGHIGCPNTLIEALPKLGIIAINGIGVDKVDLEFARQRQVRVSATPGVLTDDVADLAIGLIIALLRDLPAADAYVRAGRWTTEGDMPLGRKVSDRRFGIVGLGRIGTAIADRLAAFGPVMYTDIVEKEAPYTFYEDLESLAKNCDVLVLASSANEATRHLINDQILEALGPQGYLVNVARGSIVDEQALASALASDRIAGAALDVFEDEPNVPEGLKSSPKVVLSPHVASATVETRTAMADMVLENLDAFVAGRTLSAAVV